MASKKKTGGSRRRKLKETAEETVETKTGATQLKLADPTKLEHHLANCEAYEKKLSDLKKTVKKQYELAQAEGITKGLLKELMDLKAGDPIAARKRLEDFGIGLRVIGAPFQLNVFDAMFKNDTEQAKAEARLAARGVRGPECRFAEGSPAHQAFLEEYHRVQSEMVPGADKLTEAQRSAAADAGRAEAVH